jgi:hypothetical protein
MKALKEYRIYFIDNENDEPQWFRCQAEDEEHAKEQVLNAYPLTDMPDIIEVFGGKGDE